MRMPLIFSRRFGSLFWCQTLTAFNDNFYKNAITILIIYKLAADMLVDTALLISAAAAMFILPFMLCSALAGQLADKYPKYLMVRIIKKYEMGLVVFAALALYSGNPWMMLSVLFLLGILAAFFGPAKYAILPELLKPEELLAGNGAVEAATFLAILIGTLLGGLVILSPNGIDIAAVVLLSMGAIGVISSHYIPVTKQRSTDVKPQWNIFASSWGMVCHARKNKRIFRSILGISWFWAVGATYITQIPIFTKEVVHGDEQVVTFFLALFSVGIAIGSLACHHLLHDRVSFKYAPWALLVMSLSGIDVWWLSQSLPISEGGFLNLSQFLDYTIHWHLVAAMVAMSFAGGIFTVPLYTSLQTFSDASVRARTVASNNVFSALFMALSSAAAAIMYGVGFEVQHVLLLASVLNLAFIRMFLKEVDAP
jgi:acyl-[acyl-carrier-protein]-phospholipid O-acyltransferase/long-chain-fatty-acid--[acyl-carrier-protein] ligase